MTTYRPTMPSAELGTYGWSSLDAGVQDDLDAQAQHLAELEMERQQREDEQRAYEAMLNRPVPPEAQAANMAAQQRADEQRQTSPSSPSAQGPESAPPTTPAPPAHQGPGGWELGGSPRDVVANPPAETEDQLAERLARELSASMEPPTGELYDRRLSPQQGPPTPPEFQTQAPASRESWRQGGVPDVREAMQPPAAQPRAPEEYRTPEEQQAYELGQVPEDVGGQIERLGQLSATANPAAIVRRGVQAIPGVEQANEERRFDAGPLSLTPLDVAEGVGSAVAPMDALGVSGGAVLGAGARVAQRGAGAAARAGRGALEDVGRVGFEDVGRAVEPVAEPYRAFGGGEFYHGTNAAFDTPDPGKFSEYGLYGPGYYITSDPRVAGGVVHRGTWGIHPETGTTMTPEGTSYIVNRGQLEAPGYAQKVGGVSMDDLGDMAYKMWREAEYSPGYFQRSTATDLEKFINVEMPRMEREGIPPDSAYNYFASILSRDIPNPDSYLQRQFPEIFAQGGNVRKVAAPEDLRLLDADERIGDRPYANLVGTLNTLDGNGGAVLDAYLRTNNPHVQPHTLTGTDIYNGMLSTKYDRATASKALAAAGYDGITYAGGKRVPMMDPIKGEAVQHDAAVIFPESLGKITNAFTGRAGGGVQADVGTALGGAGASQVGTDENTSLQERLARGAVGAAGGYAVGQMAGRGGRSTFGDVARASESRQPFRSGLGPTPPSGAAVPPTDVQPPFYSALRRAVEEKMPNRTSAQQLQGVLNNAGVKPEEVRWTGIDDLLKDPRRTLTKEEVLAHLDQNEVQVQEVLKKAPDYERYPDAHLLYDTPKSVTKYDQYQLPGGQNYRELLLTLPQKAAPLDETKAILATAQNYGSDASPIWTVVDENNRSLGQYGADRAAADRHVATLRGGSFAAVPPPSYRSPHWEEPNVLSTVRFNDRLDAEGKRVLFIEEIQSDWHQAGRKHGYQGQGPEWDEANALAKQYGLETYPAFQEATAVLRGKGATTSMSREDASRLRDLSDRLYRANPEGQVPQAPFAKTWPDLTLKRMLRYAAENGYDRVAWTTGQHQIDRYALERFVEYIRYKPLTGGGFSLSAKPLNGGEQILKTLRPEQLDDTVGREVAERIRMNTGKELDQGYRELSGDDLKVGGEGMRSFYDRTLPNTANQLGKKWGAKVQNTDILTNPQYTARDLQQGGPATKDLLQKYGESERVHSLDVTPAMKQSVMQGQPFFAGGPPEMGGALAGAAGSQIGTDENTTPEERIARAAVGAAGGYAAGRMAGRGGRPTFGEVGRSTGSQPFKTFDPIADTVAAATPEGDAVLGRLRQMRERVTAGPQQTLRTRYEQMANWWEKQVPDQNIAVNRLGPNAEREASLYAARGAVADLRVKEGATPVLDAVQGIEDRFGEFVKLQRDLEVASLPRFAGQDRAFSAGITTPDEIKAALNSLRAEVGEDAWQRMVQGDQLRQQALDKLLDDKVAVGLVPQDLADYLKSTQPHFNPTRIDEAASEYATSTVGQRGATLQSSNTIRRLSELGHTEDTANPIETFVDALKSGELAIQRNRLGQAIALDAMRSGVAEQVPNVRLTRGALTRPIEDAAGNIVTTGQVASKFAPWEAPPGHISVMERGVRTLYKVPDDVAETAKRLGEGLDPVAQNFFIQLSKATQAPARAAFTSMSPRFLPVNMVADAVTVFLREGAKTTGRIPAGWYHALVKDDVWKQVVREGGLSGGLAGKSDDEIVRELTRGTSADLVRRVKQSGGRVVRNPGELMRLFTPKELAREFGLDLVAGTTGAGISAVSAPEDERGEAALKGAAIYAGGRRVLGQVQQIAEEAPRIATFQSRLAKGELPRDAALAARRVTVDFSRGGEAMKVANNFMLFANAGAQGMLQLPRTLRDVPSSRYRVAGLAAAALVAHEWNQQFPEYQDVPDWAKMSGAIVMLPGSEKNDNGVGYKRLNYVMIPLREWAAFTAPLTYMLDAAAGNAMAPAGELAREFALNYAPGVPKGEVPYFGPQALRGPVEVAFNKSLFTGSPIETPSMEGLPPSHRYTERTSALALSPEARQLAETLHLSPVQVDYLIKSELGTLGATMLEGSNVTAGRPLSEGAVPVASGLLAGVWRTYGGAIRDRQYRTYDEAIQRIEPVLTERIEQSPEYQRATPDRQKQMLRSEMRTLQDMLKAEYGLEPTAKDLGQPQRYVGVTDPKEEARIDRQKTAANRPTSTAAERSQAERHIETAAYKAWKERQNREAPQQQEQTRQQIRELIGAGR